MSDTIKFRKLKNGARIDMPVHKGDCGYDVYATKRIELTPQSHKKVGLGFALEFDDSLVCMVQAKSGLAAKHGLTTIGNVVDSSYRGEIHAILHNASDEFIVLNQGDKIAQLIFLRCETPKIIKSSKLSNTSRNSKGFGSTDIVNRKI